MGDLIDRVNAKFDKVLEENGGRLPKVIISIIADNDARVVYEAENVALLLGIDCDSIDIISGSETEKIVFEDETDQGIGMGFGPMAALGRIIFRFAKANSDLLKWSAAWSMLNSLKNSVENEKAAVEDTCCCMDGRCCTDAAAVVENKEV